MRSGGLAPIAYRGFYSIYLIAIREMYILPNAIHANIAHDNSLIRKRQTRKKNKKKTSPGYLCKIQVIIRPAHYPTASLQYTFHAPRFLCIFNQKASLAEYSFHSLNDPLKRALGAFFLREACEGQIRFAATFQYREGFDGEGDRADMEG